MMHENNENTDFFDLNNTVNDMSQQQEQEEIERENRIEAAKTARNTISDEQWHSDPIYAKIDEWMIEGVPADVIKRRVARYCEKQRAINENN